MLSSLMALKEDYVLAQDLLPEGQGAVHKVKTERFINAWTGEAVIIEP